MEHKMYKANRGLQTAGLQRTLDVWDREKQRQAGDTQLGALAAVAMLGDCYTDGDGKHNIHTGKLLCTNTVPTSCKTWGVQSACYPYKHWPAAGSRRCVDTTNNQTHTSIPSVIVWGLTGRGWWLQRRYNQTLKTTRYINVYLTNGLKVFDHVWKR